jgi:hypothetical protein
MGKARARLSGESLPRAVPAVRLRPLGVVPDATRFPDEGARRAPRDRRDAAGEVRMSYRTFVGSNGTKFDYKWPLGDEFLVEIAKETDAVRIAGKQPQFFVPTEDLMQFAVHISSIGEKAVSLDDYDIETGTMILEHAAECIQCRRAMDRCREYGALIQTRAKERPVRVQ